METGFHWQLDKSYILHNLSHSTYSTKVTDLGGKCLECLKSVLANQQGAAMTWVCPGDN